MVQTGLGFLAVTLLGRMAPVDFVVLHPHQIVQVQGLDLVHGWTNSEVFGFLVDVGILFHIVAT